MSMIERSEGWTLLWTFHANTSGADALKGLLAPGPPPTDRLRLPDGAEILRDGLDPVLAETLACCLCDFRAATPENGVGPLCCLVRESFGAGFPGRLWRLSLSCPLADPDRLARAAARSMAASRSDPGEPALVDESALDLLCGSRRVEDAARILFSGAAEGILAARPERFLLPRGIGFLGGDDEPAEDTPWELARARSCHRGLLGIGSALPARGPDRL